jgi:hypothetical protein
VLRTVAESIDEDSALLGAELPWLRIGESLQAEIDGEWIDASPMSIALDVDDAGTPRLRLRVALSRPRRDTTLPYFFSSSDTPTHVVRAELDAIMEGGETEWARKRMAAANAEPPRMALTPPTTESQQRGLQLVRKASARRVRLAVARVLIVVLFAVAGALTWRLVHRKLTAVSGDVPVDVRPVVSPPTKQPLIENERDPVAEEPEAAPAEPAPESTNPSYLRKRRLH